MKPEVLWNTHKEAYVGMSMAIEHLRLISHWPGMTTDVQRIIKGCEVCQMAKTLSWLLPVGFNIYLQVHPGRDWELTYLGHYQILTGATYVYWCW